MHDFLAILVVVAVVPCKLLVINGCCILIV